jgi:hypothetical protein
MLSAITTPRVEFDPDTQIPGEAVDPAEPYPSAVFPMILRCSKWPPLAGSA